MLAIGYVIAACLGLSLIYAVYGLAVGHKLHLQDSA